MRLHVLGLAHSPISLDSFRDPFAGLCFNFCRMMRGLGHEIILYGAVGSDPSICDEFVEVVTQKVYDESYGRADKGTYQFDSSVGSWNGGREDKAWVQFHVKTAAALNDRLTEEPELVLAMIGWAAAPALAHLPKNAIVVEPTVGYGTTVAPNRVFPSYAWMHWIKAKDGGKEGDGPPRNDAVIQHYLDPAHFEFREKKGDYFLFMGRINETKGYRVALEACKKAGVPLKVVGQLPRDPEGERVTLATIRDLGGEYVPSVGIDQRRELLAGARAALCLVTYTEPFGLVAIEAAMSGTPVISTDLGGYTETVEHGVTGWRCLTTGDIEEAINRVGEISPKACRARAERKNSMAAIGPKYEAYLGKLLHVTGGKKAAPNLDWMREAT